MLSLACPSLCLNLTVLPMLMWATPEGQTPELPLARGLQHTWPVCICGQAVCQALKTPHWEWSRVDCLRELGNVNNEHSKKGWIQGGWCKNYICNREIICPFRWRVSLLAAVTKCHRLGNFTNRNWLSHSSGDWKFKIKMSAVPTPFKALGKDLFQASLGTTLAHSK